MALGILVDGGAAAQGADEDGQVLASGDLLEVALEVGGGEVHAFPVVGVAKDFTFQVGEAQGVRLGLKGDELCGGAGGQ